MAQADQEEARPPNGEGASALESRTASLLMTATFVAGGVGFWVGWARLSDDAIAAGEAVAIGVVGIVGVLSWFRHFVFSRGDAARMGWAGGFSGFQWEVGYANLAFGITALVVVFGDWGPGAVAAALIAYGLYMLQAGVLHLWQVFSEREQRVVATIVGAVVTLVFAVFLLYFGARVLEAAEAWPF